MVIDKHLLLLDDDSALRAMFEGAYSEKLNTKDESWKHKAVATPNEAAKYISDLMEKQRSGNKALVAVISDGDMSGGGSKSSEYNLSKDFAGIRKYLADNLESLRDAGIGFFVNFVGSNPEKHMEEDQYKVTSQQEFANFDSSKLKLNSLKDEDILVTPKPNFFFSKLDSFIRLVEEKAQELES